MKFSFYSHKDQPPTAKKRKKVPKEMSLGLGEIEIVENGNCSFCPKKFKTKKDALRHEKRVHGEKTFQCPQCPKAYALIEDLRQHVKITHERTIECNECDFTCGTPYLLKKHISENHSSDLVHQFTCDQCGHKSKNLFGLK